MMANIPKHVYSWEGAGPHLLSTCHCLCFLRVGGVERPSCGCYKTLSWLWLTMMAAGRVGCPDRSWHSSITLYLSPSRRHFLCGLWTTKGREETTAVLPSSEHTATGTQVSLMTREIQLPSRRVNDHNEKAHPAGITAASLPGRARCGLMPALWVTAGLAAPFLAAQRPTLSESWYHFHCPEAPWTRLMGPPHQLLMSTLMLACGAPTELLAYSFLHWPWRQPHFHVSPHYISVIPERSKLKHEIPNTSLNYT